MKKRAKTMPGVEKGSDAARLMKRGWSVRYVPGKDLPGWLWMNPAGKSLPGYRSDGPAEVPPKVRADAVRAGHLNNDQFKPGDVVAYHTIAFGEQVGSPVVAVVEGMGEPGSGLEGDDGPRVHLRCFPGWTPVFVRASILTKIKTVWHDTHKPVDGWPGKFVNMKKPPWDCTAQERKAAR